MSVSKVYVVCTKRVFSVSILKLTKNEIYVFVTNSKKIVPYSCQTLSRSRISISTDANSVILINLRLSLRYLPVIEEWT